MNKQRKRLNKMTIAIIMLTMSFGLSAWKVLDEGYCIKKGQRVADHEMIKVAFENIAPKKDKSSISFEAYIAQNPDCCAINRHPNTRSILDVLTGFNISEVELNFKKTYNAFDPNKYYEYYKSYSSVSACGEFIKEEYGTSTSNLEKSQKEN